MMLTASVLHCLLAVILAPLLVGLINRVKALVAGRRGQPLLQPYHDITKLLRKGAVYSRTTSWVFRAGPVTGLAAVLISLIVVPAGGVGSLLSFSGDFIFLAYCLGLMRFLTVLAALDTGSAFEGMGASREMLFALSAEAALLLGLSVLSVATGQLSLSGIYSHLWRFSPASASAASVLVAGVLLIVLLAENSRIPVDDPDTHLELTMIHEVMVLDHGGVDLAFIQYAAALKLWLFAALFSGIVLPLRTGRPMPDLLGTLAGVFLTALLVGVVESSMARLRLRRVPQMLVVGLAFSFAAVFWILR